MDGQTFSIRINGKEFKAKPGQSILDVSMSQDYYIPSICFHPQLGPIQTCDTCLVEVEGELVRACATEARPDLSVNTLSDRAREAQYEAMSRILANHELYCTVCDNNNGNCVVHNTAEYLEVEHQKYTFEPKPYEPDFSHPFYRYMTYKSKGITSKTPHPWVEVSPELAKERGIEHGTLVRLVSPYGQVKVRTLVTDTVTGKELYLTMNSSKDWEAVNRLTSSYHDRVTHTPNYKEMNVKMEILEQKGEPPLPKVNHRFGHRVSQIGVKVEEKWKRSDYIPIPELINEGGTPFGQSDHAH